MYSGVDVDEALQVLESALEYWDGWGGGRGLCCEKMRQGGRAGLGRFKDGEGALQ
jgi:hypothetical protein